VYNRHISDETLDDLIGYLEKLRLNSVIVRRMNKMEPCVGVNRDMKYDIKPGHDNITIV